MSNLSFGAAVSAWAKRVKEREEFVWRESGRRVVEEMQRPEGEGGNMPVQSGFLRASLRAVEGKVGSLPTTAKTTGLSVDDGSLELLIASTPLGGAISFIYTAEYAKRVNFNGHHAFVQRAAQQWKPIVRMVTQEARAATT